MAEVYSWHSACLNHQASRLCWNAPHPDLKVLDKDKEAEQSLILYNFVQLSDDFHGSLSFIYA